MKNVCIYVTYKKVKAKSNSAHDIKKACFELL